MPSIPDPTWRTGEIELLCLDKNWKPPQTFKCKTKAELYGLFAIHRPASEGEDHLLAVWEITHVPTKLRVARVKKEEDAKLIAETAMLFREDFSATSQTRLKESVPEFVRDWLAACEKELAYVDLEVPEDA